MIKLQRAAAPAYLSDEKVRELTEEFKRSGGRVWAHQEVVGALAASSNDKCAFCETIVSEESKYLEVEHFFHKDAYPEKVVEWANLLPACRRCNGRKGVHDVGKAPIINPYDNDPVKHLGFRCYRFRALTALGDETIGVLDLNNSDRVVFKRFEVGESIVEAVTVAEDRLTRWKELGTTRARNAAIASIEALLKECQPKAQYSATAATILHADDRFNALMGAAKSDGIWTDELEKLYESSLPLVLEIC